MSAYSAIDSKREKDLSFSESFSSAKITLNKATLNAISVFEKIKNNPSSLEHASCIVRHTFSNLTKLSKSLGFIETTIDLFQVFGSIHFFYKLDNNNVLSLKVLSSASFGVANLANAALWFRQQNLNILGSAALSIGTKTLDNVLTGGIVLGYSGMALSALISLRNFGEFKKLSFKQSEFQNHKYLELAWLVGEIALIVLPMMAITAPPAWSAIVVVKLIGIGSFLIAPASEQKRDNKEEREIWRC